MDPTKTGVLASTLSSIRSSRRKTEAEKPRNWRKGETAEDLSNFFRRHKKRAGKEENGILGSRKRTRKVSRGLKSPGETSEKPAKISEEKEEMEMWKF